MSDTMAPLIVVAAPLGVEVHAEGRAEDRDPVVDLTKHRLLSAEKIPAGFDGFEFACRVGQTKGGGVEGEEVESLRLGGGAVGNRPFAGETNKSRVSSGAIPNQAFDFEIRSVEGGSAGPVHVVAGCCDAREQGNSDEGEKRSGHGCWKAKKSHLGMVAECRLAL